MQEELNELRSTKDDNRAKHLLQSLKLKMITMNYLTDIKQNNESIIIRDVLELGALYSIRVKDIAAFEGLKINKRLLFTTKNLLPPFNPRISKNVYDDRPQSDSSSLVE
jgi:hypothetical protein